MGSSIKNVLTLGEGGVSYDADKSGQWEGEGLAAGGHPFQCGLWKREEGI